MGNINCRDSQCNNPPNEEINCINSTTAKPNQPSNQPPIITAERYLPLDTPTQNNNDTLTILTPTKNKSIDFSQYESNNSNNNNNNLLTDSEPQQMISQQQSSIGSLTPIRKQSTMKHSEGRKMPLEVIDEINGEMMNVNTYEAYPTQKTNANQKSSKTYITASSISSEKKPPHVYKKKDWRDMKITSIIPEEKLLNAGKNDILFQGEFYKFTKENDIKKIDATSKYLILTRSELRIYRSKEIVLHMLSPLQRISLFNISQCDIISVADNKYMKNLCKYNFCIEFITVNGMKIDADDKLSINSTHQLDNSLYKKSKRLLR